MKEFDTSVKLRGMDMTEVKSGLDKEQFCGKMFDIFIANAKEVGDAGGGEYWLDCSTPLVTKYIVCNISSEEEGSYELRFKAGSKPDRFADVVIMLLLLGAVWFVSKLFVPDPSSIYVVGLVVCAAIGGLLASIFMRPFGSVETKRLISTISRTEF